MDIKDLFQKVIPSRDYIHREGFSNIPIINSLTDYELLLLENELINKLDDEVEQQLSIDTLIVNTLEFIKSTKSIPVLYKVLKSNLNNIDKIITASAIYQLNEDQKMIDISINSLLQIDNKEIDPHYIYTLIPAFDYMIKFKDERTTALVEKYVNHKEYLVSYNAKKALGYG